MPTFILRSVVTRFAGSLLALSLLAGCAVAPPADDAEAVAEFKQVNDPLEPMNRAIFEFNDVVDRALLRPVAQGYRDAVPPFGRDRVRDFLNNLRSPIIFANDILQGEPDRAVQTFIRFAFNTGFGIGGLFDIIGGEKGVPYHDEDFGQTFAVWGVGEGPYLVLPILGASNARDAVGTATEMAAEPFGLWMDNTGRDWAMWTRIGMAGVDKRERYLDTLDEVRRSSLDYYSAVRALYRQRRAVEIRNRVVDDKAPVQELR